MTTVADECSSNLILLTTLTTTQICWVDDVMMLRGFVMTYARAEHNIIDVRPNKGLRYC